MTRPIRAITVGLAVTASLFGCARGAPVVSAENAAAAQALGARLAAQDRADTLRHRAELARLMRLTIERFDEFDRKITIRLRVHNLSSKNVRAIEAGLEVDDLSGARIATTEVHRTADIPPHGSLAIDISMPYTQFGEDTGSMREALGKPQRQRIDVKEIKYSDGSDAGYDD